MPLRPVFVRRGRAPAGARLELLDQVLRAEDRRIGRERLHQPRVRQVALDVRVRHQHLQRALHAAQHRVGRPHHAARAVVEGDHPDAQFSTSTQPVPIQWRASASNPGVRVRSPTSATTARGRIGRPQRRSPSWRLRCSIAPIGCTPRRSSAPPPAVPPLLRIRRVRAAVALAAAHLQDGATRGRRQSIGFGDRRRIHPVLGVHQLHAGLARRLDHGRGIVVGGPQHLGARNAARLDILGQRGAVEGRQRLGADHVLARLGGRGFGHRPMQVVRARTGRRRRRRLARAPARARYTRRATPWRAGVGLGALARAADRGDDARLVAGDARVRARARLGDEAVPTIAMLTCWRGILLFYPG